MTELGLRGGQYRPLSETDIEEIHESALTILETTGMGYEKGLEETVEDLKAAGCGINADEGRLLFPRKVVEDQVRKAPREVVLSSRKSGYDLRLSGDRVHLGTGGAALHVLDLDDTIRPSRLEDIYRIARLTEHLEQVHFFIRPCVPQDIETRLYDENIYFASFLGTGKHVMGGVNDIRGLHTLYRMASIAAGGNEEYTKRPIASVITSFAISPLKFCTHSVRIMREACRLGVPVALSSAPSGGVTAPVTLSGQLAQLHAEELAGITLTQVTRPGAPVLYGGIPGAADFSTLGYRGGAVECGMMNASIHQLARYIGVPNYNSAGLSDSHRPDVRAGWEKGMTVLLAAMGGSNFIHHAAGMLGSMNTVSYAQYVLDDEIIGMALRVLKGITLGPEQLALSVIADPLERAGYMTSPHTLEHMREEFFQGNGVSLGTDHDALERAKTTAERLIEESEESHLPPEVERELRKEYTILLKMGEKG